MMKQRYQTILWAAGLLATAVAGCTVGPDYRSPEVRMPSRYGTHPTTLLATTQASSELNATTAPSLADRPADEQVADLTQWWKGFQDPALDSLIERAVKGNLTIRQYEARLRQARAMLGVDAAQWYPTVTPGASFSRQRTGGGFGSSGSGGGGSPASGGYNTYRAGVDASWELDIFGGTRRQVESDRDTIEAAELDRRAFVVSTLGEVANNYVLLRGAQQRIRIALDNIESERQTLGLNQSRFEAGIDSEADVARARAQVATFEAAVPPYRTQEATALHALGILLGMEPEALREELSPPRAIPMALPSIPIGLPSDLLQRRPDLRAAERRLASSTAQIGVATAELFPSFSLTGSFGYQAGRARDLGSTRGLFWSYGPAVSWNAFDGGRIRSNIRLKTEVQSENLTLYESAILNALRDVEDAISTYKNAVDQREAIGRAVQASRRSVELISERFRGGQGVSSLLDVLVEQRNLFAEEDTLVLTETNLSQSLVSIYKALGGGWETFRENPPPQFPGTRPSAEAGER